MSGHHGRVVVGFHGTEASLRALQQAVTVARDRGWDVDVVTAWPEADEVFVHDVPGHYMVARGRAMQWQDEALAALDPGDLPHVSTFLVNARPAVALLAMCDGADLLVLGKGHPEPEQREESVGAACSGAAPCPMVVVPTRDIEAAARRRDTRPGAQHRRGRRTGGRTHTLSTG
jgi:nucleotide-binding universal stress UspA family protein